MEKKKIASKKQQLARSFEKALNLYSSSNEAENCKSGCNGSLSSFSLHLYCIMSHDVLTRSKLTFKEALFYSYSCVDI